MTMSSCRVLKAIHRYLPDVYADQVVVDFECGCWTGSRSEWFGYDCPLHAKHSAPPPSASPAGGSTPKPDFALADSAPLPERPSA